MHLKLVHHPLGVRQGSLPVSGRSCNRLIGPQITRDEGTEVIAAVRASV